MFDQLTETERAEAEQVNEFAEAARKAIAGDVAVILVMKGKDWCPGMSLRGQPNEAGELMISATVALCTYAQTLFDMQEQGGQIVLRFADGEEISNWHTPDIIIEPR